MAASCQGFIQTTTNSLTAALVAPLACVTPLRLTSAQVGLVTLGLAATLAYTSFIKTPESKLNSSMESDEEMEVVPPEA